MKWRGRRQSTNVIDRRGQSSGGGGGFSLGGLGGGSGGGFRFPTGGGGGGLGAGGLGGMGIVVIAIIAFFLFANPFGGEDTTTPTTPGTTATTGTIAGDDASAFVATILADTEDVWTEVFRTEGQTYQQPQLVLYTGSTSTACGQGQSAMGPFYCPVDRMVYLDTAFFDELEREFGAAGDFPPAYVIAHEIGHHVQNLTGTFALEQRLAAGRSEAEQNALSVRVELQADCYAGIWSAFTDRAGLLDDGDIQEAMDAAASIGDDTLQRRGQGYIVPETFTHGTSQERMTWFRRGYDSGQVAACDTFEGLR